MCGCGGAGRGASAALNPQRPPPALAPLTTRAPNPPPHPPPTTRGATRCSAPSAPRSPAACQRVTRACCHSWRRCCSPTPRGAPPPRRHCSIPGSCSPTSWLVAGWPAGFAGGWAPCWLGGQCSGEGGSTGAAAAAAAGSRRAAVVQQGCCAVEWGRAGGQAGRQETARRARDQHSNFSHGGAARFWGAFARWLVPSSC